MSAVSSGFVFRTENGQHETKLIVTPKIERCKRRLQAEWPLERQECHLIAETHLKNDSKMSICEGISLPFCIFRILMHSPLYQQIVEKKSEYARDAKLGNVLSMFW